ncbi:YcbK family protein [Burkholderia cenocepacia]|uniref:YcbK family protein n=1 Tax=Burkholderia cenocepacia TaxID=95486 RepID=UPI000760EBCF|nr:DUF882 domain-containing protein [Burkholderia cenocepacia]KWU17767.1 hypothetical protein AS149_13690 [Burkholderia cenocepacia]
MLIPPDQLRATLDSRVFSRENVPDVGLVHPFPARNVLTGRRAFLRAAAGFAAAGIFSGAHAAAGPLVFNTEPHPTADAVASDAESAPRPQPAAADPNAPQLVVGGQTGPQQALRQLALGEIPADFWDRPRELNIQRGGEHLKLVYWRDGQIVPEGYWAACRLLRDVRANQMTYMDPAALDILRGLLGYYEAWGWNQPVIINSGFRTASTNNSLLSEGAAKNSMHLYGRAIDLHMEGIPVAHLMQLGLYFRRGGVGFYPPTNRRIGFVHLDTGRLRTWRG